VQFAEIVHDAFQALSFPVELAVDAIDETIVLLLEERLFPRSLLVLLAELLDLLLLGLIRA
jgi:hypothetical protein